MGNSNTKDLESTQVPKINELLDQDGYLKPFEGEIRRRYGCFQNFLKQIDTNENGLDEFTNSYKKYGLHINADNSITALEWAPAAKNIYLRGDFSMLI
jgi:1,4-alpha-glucan branching enzyme